MTEDDSSTPLAATDTKRSPSQLAKDWEVDSQLVKDWHFRRRLVNGTSARQLVSHFECPECLGDAPPERKKQMDSQRESSSVSHASAPSSADAVLATQHEANANRKVGDG